VFFGTNTEEALKKWISTRNTIINNNNEKALFISKLHTRMSRDAISDMLKSATQAANINKKITPHKMRSTFGMNLYAATGDIYLTQNAMGHANIENTKIYVKATQKQMKDAANVVDVLY
jgi:Site-specific recombinase XerC